MCQLRGVKGKMNKNIDKIKKLTKYALITLILLIIPINIALILLYALIGSTISLNISKLFI
jgi:hypothetical protein